MPLPSESVDESILADMFRGCLAPIYRMPSFADYRPGPNLADLEARVEALEKRAGIDERKERMREMGFVFPGDERREKNAVNGDKNRIEPSFNG